jgi:hypothetical protein
LRSTAAAKEIDSPLASLALPELKDDEPRDIGDKLVVDLGNR